VDPLDERAARVAALDALARRDHASEALRRKLLDKGYDAGILDGVIERLIAEHLLDDRRFVDNFVVYHAARGQGPLRVRLQLRQMGLTGEIVEAALAKFPDWSSKLQEARKKKFGAALPRDYAERQRQAKFLSYRGFTGAQIRAALGIDTDGNGHDDTL
jgi:regulatory protein